jgi:hypothetical protein
MTAYWRGGPTGYGIDHVEIGVGVGQILPVTLAGVFRRQGRHHARDLGRGAQILGSAAHNQPVLAAFQVHHKARVGGEVARLGSAALAVEVKSLAGHCSPYRGCMRGT